MKNNNMVITIIVAVIVAAVAFFGGMQYQKSQVSTALSATGRTGSAGQFRQRAGANGQTPTRGEVVSISGQNMTVKLPDNSSKIVLLSDKTVVSQSATASATDIKSGDQVLVLGTSNSDGSVTAQDVQINPNFGGQRTN